MNDTVPAMRLAVLLALGAAACGDDLSIVVDVTNPTPVNHTVISVYESDAVTCDSIEFGDLDATALQSALVAEEIYDSAGKVLSGSLDGISRTKNKAIVARGYDASDALITAGCTAKGVVHGTDHVKIDTVDAATVSAVADTSNDFLINVFATKSDGTFLDKRKVSWHVYAPIGTAPYAPASVTIDGASEWEPNNAACTNNNGSAKLHPIPPSLIGGYATRVRASWAANEIPLQSAISKADADQMPIKPPAGAVHACAVRTSGGTRRLVCLDSQLITGNPIARELSVTVANGRTTIAITGTTTPFASAPIGVIALPGAVSGDKNVYAVTSMGDLLPVFGAPAVAATTCSGCTGPVTDYLFVPSCDPPDTAPKVLLKSGAKLFGMPATGGAAIEITGASDALFTDFSFNGAGCVTDAIAKASRQLVMIDATIGGVSLSRGFYACTGGGADCHRIALPLAGAGVAFALTDNGEHRLVGASIDATGVVMSSYVILPDPSTGAASKLDRLLEKDRVPAAAVPHKVLAGKLDDDDGYDLVWDVAAMRGSTLEIAYSRLAGNQRLESISGLQAVGADDLLLDDLSGDGHPDIVIVAAPSGGNVVLNVIPTHVPPAAPSITIDDCK